MIRTFDGSVNFAGVRLHRTTYESPVDVSAGFEQMACGSGGHTRSWHDIPESGACQCTCHGRLGSIQVRVTRKDDHLRRHVLRLGAIQFRCWLKSLDRAEQQPGDQTNKHNAFPH